VSVGNEMMIKKKESDADKILYLTQMMIKDFSKKKHYLQIREYYFYICRLRIKIRDIILKVRAERKKKPTIYFVYYNFAYGFL
jgi:hypothetical protein